MAFSEKNLKPERKLEKKEWKIVIPENEYTIRYILSRGPGGQNVNRRKTCAELFFSIYESQTLTPEQQQMLVDNYPYPHEISSEGVIRITAQEERSQEQNRKRAIEKLCENINMALRPKEKRITKKPGWVRKKQANKRKRFKDERKKIKQWRKPPENPPQ